MLTNLQKFNHLLTDNSLNKHMTDMVTISRPNKLHRIDRHAWVPYNTPKTVKIEKIEKQNSEIKNNEATTIVPLHSEQLKINENEDGDLHESELSRNSEEAKTKVELDESCELSNTDKLSTTKDHEKIVNENNVESKIM